MKELKINTKGSNVVKNIIKIVIIILLALIMLATLSGCSNNYSGAAVVQSSTRYYPYDYYYYPNTSIYFHIATGYYHYHDGRGWRRARSLPSRYILNSRDRVRLVINSDRPYLSHHKHRARYKPRPSYRKDRKIDLIERRNNNLRYKRYRR